MFYSDVCDSRPMALQSLLVVSPIYQTCIKAPQRPAVGETGAEGSAMEYR